MTQLVEGKTGTASDGTRVIVRNGQVVPMADDNSAPGRRLLPTAATGDRRSEEAYYGRLRTAGDPAVNQAEQGVAASRRAEGLIARQEAQGGMFGGTGGIYAVPVLGQVAGLFDPEIRELDAIQARQSRLERQPGEGAISDFDAAQFVAMTYGKDKPVETNRALIQAQRVVNDATLQRREFQEWFFNNYKTSSGVQEAWRTYAQENPIFDPASQQDGGQPRLNQNRPTWREYFTGERGLSTQAEIDARASASPGAGPTDPETGLPTYPGLTPTNATDIPPPPGGYGGGPVDPNAPQPGDVRVTQSALAPTDTPNSLSAQGFVYDAASDTWKRRRTEQVPSAVDRGWTPESAVAQRRQMDDGFLGGIGRNVDAFIRGAADSSSLETVDEMAAGADAFFGQGVGADFGTRFNNNLEVQRAVDAADGQDVGFARNAGEVAGAVLGGGVLGRLAPQALRLVPRPIVRGSLSTLANMGRIVGNGLRLATGGAAVGAVAGGGASDGSFMERVPDMIQGGVIGALAAPVVSAVAQPVIGALSNVVRPVVRAAGQVGSALNIPGAANLAREATPNALDTALPKFANRQGVTPEAMAAEAQRLRAMGIEPTIADLTDDAGRGNLRANATRPTPARTAAREFSDQRAEGLQDRVSTQARRTISDDARAPDEIRTEVAARRSREGNVAFGAVRNEPITPEPQIIAALRSPAGKAAVNDAAERASNRGDIETANQLRQLAESALDDPSGVQITVGMADRIARTLNGLGEARRGTVMAPGDNDAAASFFSLAEALRGTARRQVQGYDDALRAYGDDSKLIQATALGEQFMTMEADQFAKAVTALGPDERALAQAAARRAVERAAGTQGQAPGVAQRLAGGREQGMRSDALLDDARPMQDAMRAERDGVMNARGVSPMTGSPTSSNLQDALGAAGDVAGGTRELMTGNLPGLMTRVGRRFLSRGFSNAEAEAIVTAAIDPARTDDVIRAMTTRMSQREARNTLRVIRHLATQNAAATSAQSQ